MKGNRRRRWEKGNLDGFEFVNKKQNKSGKLLCECARKSEKINSNFEILHV
jgi:hypothetical protein